MPVTLFAATSLRAATRTGGFDDITPLFLTVNRLIGPETAYRHVEHPGSGRSKKKQIIFNYIKIVL